METSQLNVKPSVKSVLLALPPDGGYGWVIVFASFMINFVIDGIIYSFGNTMAEIAKDLPTSQTQISIVGSLKQGLFYLMGPLASAFVNRFGLRVVVLVGACITLIGILAASFVSSYVELVLCYGILGGIGFGIMFPPTIIIIAYYFEKYRVISTGIGLSGSSFGVLCLSPLFSTITENYGWRVTMRVQSACSIICMIASIAYRPIKPVKVMVTEGMQQSGNLQSDKTVQHHGSSGIRKTKSTNNVSFANNNHRTPSNYSVKLFKDIDVKSIKESTHLISTETKAIGPLDRKFYGACLAFLPEYRSKKTVVDTEPRNYHLSMIHGPNITEQNAQPGWHHMSHTIKGVLGLLFDVSILQSPAFFIFTMSSCCYVFVLYVPYMFIKKRADQQKIPEKFSSLFIPAVFVGNFMGRILSGALGSLLPTIHPCHLIGLSSTIAGIFTVISAFVLENSESFQFVFCTVTGFFIAFMVSLRPIVIVYLVGLKKLSNGFGLNMLIMGLTGLSGVPVATAIYEATNAYTYTFLLTGCFFLVSGILMVLSLHVHLWKQAQTSKN